MSKLLLIVGGCLAVALLAAGIFFATRPVSVLMSEAEAGAQLEVLGEQFSAAIENERDVSPLLEPVKRIVDQRPGLRAGRTLLGQVYARRGQTREAYEQFAAALQLEPDDAQLQNLAGTAAQLIGEAQLAETHHRLAIRAAPDEPRLRLPLADVLIEAGRWDEARDVLLTALEQQLTMHEGHAALSDVYAGRWAARRTAAGNVGGEGEGAAETGADTRRFGPGAGLSVGFGEGVDDAGGEGGGEGGDLVLAIEQMERARAQVRNDPKGREQEIVYVRKLARLYAQRGEAMEAMRVLDTLMPEAGRLRPDVLAELAGYLELNGQAALAGLQYEMAADQRPDEPVYLAEAARWYARTGNPVRAAVMIDRLRRLTPSHPAVSWWDGQG